jgi:hypothetical protein
VAIIAAKDWGIATACAMMVANPKKRLGHGHSSFVVCRRARNSRILADYFFWDRTNVEKTRQIGRRQAAVSPPNYGGLLFLIEAK